MKRIFKQYTPIHFKSDYHALANGHRISESRYQRFTKEVMVKYNNMLARYAVMTSTSAVVSAPVIYDIFGPSKPYPELTYGGQYADLHESGFLLSDIVGMPIAAVIYATLVYSIVANINNHTSDNEAIYAYDTLRSRQRHDTL